MEEAKKGRKSEKMRDGESRRQVLESISEGGGVYAENRREGFHCIPIIGQIEGHYLLPEGQKATKYEQLLPLLVSLEEDETVDGILIVLNTMGGDVEAGLALAEMIASMTKPTVSLVLGEGIPSAFRWRPLPSIRSSFPAPP